MDPSLTETVPAVLFMLGSVLRAAGGEGLRLSLNALTDIIIPLPPIPRATIASSGPEPRSPTYLSTAHVTSNSNFNELMFSTDET